MTTPPITITRAGTAAPKPPPKPAWIIQAEKHLGVKEALGAANNPTVVAFYRDAGFAGIKDDATPWCAAFVGAMLKRSGLDTSASLAARSYETYGKRLAQPIYGCIGVKKRVGASWSGHVGFVVAANASTVWLLGGNQNDAVSIAAFRRSEFTAFVWPLGVPFTQIKLPDSHAVKTSAREN